jgi:hypothetical protein
VFFSAKLPDFFARLAAGLLLGLLLGGLISEGAYLLLPNKQLRRAPEQIEIVIPAGTSAKIEQGQSTSILPDDMRFVEGDVLLVTNQDAVPHQLGPLFAPPGATSRLALDAANQYTYACSFETDRYVGLEVVPQLSLNTRLEGLATIGLPTGMMLFVYSFLIPVKKKG